MACFLLSRATRAAGAVKSRLSSMLSEVTVGSRGVSQSVIIVVEWVESVEMGVAEASEDRSY
jgi:hypothetical protein